MDKAMQKVQDEIAKLQRKHDELKASLRRMEEVKRIVQAMRDTAITPQDILAAYKAGRAKGKGAARPNARGPRGPVAPKYRHPVSGQTWTGRGKAPRWLAVEERNGAHRQQFLIAADRSAE